MIFYQIDAGGDRNFAYIIGDKDGGKAALFDPPPNSDRYLKLLEQHKLQVEYVFITHGHGDHTWGVSEAVERYDAKVVGHKSMLLKLDAPVDDGDTLPLGELELQIIHTPGHTDDAICILCLDKLITGDTLFVGKVGGTDLGDGARKEWDSLHKLMKLDPKVEVWPGHDFGTAPSSTIGRELESNPFLLRETFEDFVDLKVNWIQYKKEHGID
jgi:glyoxylase-like metal-dependent hydrolase (beta-lactamase superfamily II)